MLLYWLKLSSTALLTAFLFIQQCTDPTANVESSLIASDQYQFLDSIAAGEAITQDKSERFFDKISLLDMQIQMGSSDIKDRTHCVAAYKSFLKRDVGTFTKKEQLFLSSILDSAFNAVASINPNLINFNIDLIKMHGQHYGDGVYFTRDRGIFIPQNELDGNNFEKVYTVMLHEIFHILSRENKVLRNQLYELIGFRPMNKPFVFKESVANRQLTNPDGVNVDFYIKLKYGDETKKGAALIVSSENEFNPVRNSFFEYLKFDLYEVIESDDRFSLVANDAGFSTMDPLFMESFFTQIKDNTKYIIHPDEIMADNFMLLVLAESKGGIKGFSTDGTNLLQEVKRLLKSVK